MVSARWVKCVKRVAWHTAWLHALHLLPNPKLWTVHGLHERLRVFGFFGGGL